MKKCIVIFIWLLNSIASNSQTVNYAYQEGDEESGNIIGINNKRYYLSKTTPVPSCCHDVVSVTGLDENGSQIFRTGIVGDAHLDYFKLTPTADKRLLAYAGTRWKGCDYGGARYSICMLDTSGVVLWNYSMNRRIENIFPRVDGSFDALTPDSLLHFSSNGSIIKKTPLNFSANINSSTMLMNGNILINSGWSSTLRFRIIDTNATILWDQPTSFVTTRLGECSDGTKFAIVSNHLVKYDSALNIVANTQSVLPSNISISALFCRNDSVFLAGNDSQEQPLYLLVNKNLNVLHQSNSSLKTYKSTGIYVHKGMVNILATGSSVPSSPFGSHTFTGYFQLPILGNLSAKNDIGVTDVKIIWDSIFETTLYSSTMKIFIGFVNADVKVKNFGTDTIYDFSLNHYSSRNAMWTSCHNGLHKRYSEVIPPGSEITVNTGTFGIQQFNQHALNPDGSVDLSICISSAIPNFKCDSEIANDQNCVSLIHQTVGIKEDHLSFQNLKIFPNPSSDYVNISNDFQISNIEVFDLTGRRTKVIDVNNKSLKIDVQDFHSGLYIFKINSKNGTAMRKVMVQ